MSEVQHQVYSCCRDVFDSDSDDDARWCEVRREWLREGCNATWDELTEDPDVCPFWR
ncbi:MAG: hypothetical protein P4L85_07775 [Paludisphaera borealis]|uniref:hypothetical protein n=1 Tax=Paludisphaera borealis TaxID=1387353 RepID=UPI00284321CB|nr:hypothetical protein [Paludisphaera borealis]MDR3619232.1 hypothetical protein [Paludisphaera borealis]